MDFSAVKALTFDVFGTVVDWRTGVARHAREIAGARGIEANWEDFADAWRALYPVKMEEVRSGARPWVKLDVLHRESLETIAPRFGLEQLSATELDVLSLAWHELDPGRMPSRDSPVCARSTSWHRCPTAMFP
jgi:2-haloacid dehalogenase